MDKLIEENLDLNYITDKGLEIPVSSEEEYYFEDSGYFKAETIRNNHMES